MDRMGVWHGLSEYQLAKALRRSGTDTETGHDEGRAHPEVTRRRDEVFDTEAFGLLTSPCIERHRPDLTGQADLTPRRGRTERSVDG